MKLAGLVRLLGVVALAGLATAWVTQDATLQKGAGAAEPQPFFMKNISVALGDDQMVNLHLMVGLGPLCSVEGVEGVQHRPLVISSVFDYGCVLTSSSTSFSMVDATTADAVPVNGGGADPVEAKWFASKLLGDSTKYVEGEPLPSWRITVQPNEGLTWGGIASKADLSVTWEPIAPGEKK